MRTARARALDLGVKMALENHGDLQARELKTVLEEAGKDAAGACLDTGNPVFTLEDPLLSLEVLAPYVATTHFRDSVLYEHPRGCAAQWVALGDGSIDFRGFLDSFQKLCPGGAVHLEIITGRPPTVFPYLEPKFWDSFPKMPAADFARFLSLVKRGRPFDGHMVIADRGGPPLPEYQAALKEQQRHDLERSLRYAREKLGLGPRARSA